MTIPYSGSLTNEAGLPVVDGTYDFSFKMYDAAIGGELLWTEVQEGVTVQGGAFSAQLGSTTPLPSEALNTGARWLEVGVRGPSESTFSALAPRQELSTASPDSPDAPQALACAHTHLNETWSGSANSTNVAFTVKNSGTGTTVKVFTDGTYGTALRADAPNGTAVYASSNHHTAIFADSDSDGIYGPTFEALNGNLTDGEAAFIQNWSGSPTARFENLGGGEVLYLRNKGAANGSGGGDFITAVDYAKTDTQFRITSNGGVMTDAGFRCGDGAPGCLQTGSADVAELVNPSETLEPGEVVEIDPTSPDHFRLARTPYSTLVAGVISANPAIVMNVQGISLAGDSAPDQRPALAMLGRVPVRVCAENGPISIGDLLVASSTPGYAMRGVNPTPGTILGKALEPLETGTGVILVLITLQ
jgi:hypothetical protein